jgi:hypothetical protein
VLLDGKQLLQFEPEPLFFVVTLLTFGPLLAVWVALYVVPKSLAWVAAGFTKHREPP